MTTQLFGESVSWCSETDGYTVVKQTGLFSIKRVQKSQYGSEFATGPTQRTKQLAWSASPPQTLPTSKYEPLIDTSSDNEPRQESLNKTIPDLNALVVTRGLLPPVWSVEMRWQGTVWRWFASRNCPVRSPSICERTKNDGSQSLLLSYVS